MIPSFSHRPLLRVVKLLYVTIFFPSEATVVYIIDWPLLQAGALRRVEMTQQSPMGTIIVSSIPSLSHTAVDADGTAHRNSTPSSFSFLFFFFLIITTRAFPLLTFSPSFWYEVCTTFVGILSFFGTGVGSSSSSPSGGCAGRFTNLPYYVICFQLVVVPPDSLDAISPTILVTFTAYIQYCWLLVFFLKHLHCVDFQQVLAFCGEVTEPHI